VPLGLVPVKEKLSAEDIRLRQEAKKKSLALCKSHLADALPAKLKNGVFECTFADKVCIVIFTILLSSCCFHEKKAVIMICNCDCCW
jgi:hypothetical protein